MEVARTRAAASSGARPTGEARGRAPAGPGLGGSLRGVAQRERERGDHPARPQELDLPAGGARGREGLPVHHSRLARGTATASRFT